MNYIEGEHLQTPEEECKLKQVLLILLKRKESEMKSVRS